jgi:hypothetical protein
MDRIIVGSSPFFPPVPEGERITAVVEGVSIDYVRRAIRGAREVVSFCGHQETAEFLDVRYSRDSAPREHFMPGVVWVGIRTVERLMPGEEMEVDPSEFVGWKMTFL